MTRGQRGRRIGRAMITFAVLVSVIVPAAVFLLSPRFMGGGPLTEPPVWTYVFYGLGVAGVVVGLVWMVRIHRADPEPDQHAWRYRAKR